MSISTSRRVMVAIWEEGDRGRSRSRCRWDRGGGYGRSRPVLGIVCSSWGHCGWGGVKQEQEKNSRKRVLCIQGSGWGGGGGGGGRAGPRGHLPGGGASGFIVRRSREEQEDLYQDGFKIGRDGGAGTRPTLARRSRWVY